MVITTCKIELYYMNIKVQKMCSQNFKTMPAAFEELRLSGDPDKNINYDINGITSLVLGHSEYYTVVNSGLSIYYLGVGSYTVYGGPSGNQYWYKQKPFYLSQLNKTPFPMFVLNHDDSVTLYGYYKVDAIYKRIGDQGFTYFHIKLLRTTYQTPQKELQAPPANLKI